MDPFLHNLFLTKLDSSNSCSNSVSNYIETEFVLLPSLGMFFSGKYKGVKQIKIKKLTYKEEMILTTESLYHNNLLLLELLKSTIVDQDFPIHELTLVDRDTIILWLRIGSYGSKYEMTYTCQNEDCKKKAEVVWDFSKLEFPDYSEEYLEELKETGFISIQINKSTIRLAPMNIFREMEVNRYIKSISDSYSSKHKSTIKLLQAIKEIKEDNNYITEVEEIHKWLKLNSLSILETRKIQKIIDEISLRITLDVESECKHCKNIEYFSLPYVDQSFFGLDIKKYKENLEDCINYLVFWGRLNYDAVLSFPVYKRRQWVDRTSENLKQLFNT